MSHLLRYLERSSAIGQEALQVAANRQAIYGGSLDTVLLELELVDAATLDSMLCAATGLASAPVHHLRPTPGGRPWDRVPENLAARGWALPIAIEDGRLLVAVHPDLPDDKLGALYRSIPGAIALVTAECVIARLGAERTGSVIPQRYAILSARYLRELAGRAPNPVVPMSGGRKDPASRLMAGSPPPPNIVTDGEPMIRVAEGSRRQPDAYGAPPPVRAGRSTMPIEPSQNTASRSPTAVYEAVPRPATPPPGATLPPIRKRPAVDPEELRRALAGPLLDVELAQHRDGVVEALVRASSFLSSRAALFAVKKNELTALPAAASVSTIAADTVVPLQPDGPLARVLAGAEQMDRVRDLDLRLAVGQEQAIPCLLERISVRGRAVMLLYIDRAGEPFDSEEGTVIRELCLAAGRALERIVVQQKTTVAPTTSTVSEVAAPSRSAAAMSPPSRQAIAMSYAPPPIRVPRPTTVPSPAASVRNPTPPPILPSLIQRPVEHSEPTSAGKHVPFPQERSMAERAATLTGNDRSVTLPGNDRSVTLPGNDRSVTLPGNDPSMTLPRGVRAAEVDDTLPSLPRIAQTDAHGEDWLRTRQAKTGNGRPTANLDPDAIPSSPLLTLNASPPPPPVPPPPVPSYEPDTAHPEPEALTGIPGEGGPRFRPPLMEPASIPEVFSLSGAHAHEPARARIQLDDEDHLARVAPADSIEARADRIIDQVIEVEGGSVSRLREIGTSAFLRLAGRFPGPLEVLRRDLNALPPPSAHGPLVRAAIRLGREMTPHLVELLDHPSPDVRFYAAFVFQELRDTRCIRGLSELAFDPTTEVRIIAMRVLETYARAPEFAEAAAHIRAELGSQNRGRQLHAARAVGTLRDRVSIPQLVELLGHRDRFIQEAALESLCSITGQQHGLKPHRWRSWFEANRERHRVEWIIDSLRHKDLPVRRWAYDELARITGHRVPCSPAGDRREQAACAEAWMQWWGDEGRAKLGA